MDDRDPNYRIVDVILDERTVVRRSPEVEHERAVALYDLIEDNYFRPRECPPGPYRLYLSIRDNRLIIDVRTADEAALKEVKLSVAGFRRLVRDYFMICESYYSAIKTASLSQIEAIDMGRRGLHNEGAEQLREKLSSDVEIDHTTARRLFTLVCVLHIRG